VRAQLPGQRVDVAGVVVVLADEAQFGHAARLRAQRITASMTLAVVAAAYCGYSGSTSTRVAPSARSASSTEGHRRLAVAHGMAHQHGHGRASRSAACSRGLARVQTASGEPSGIQTLAYLAADRPAACAG
jgi:Flp pilus assembly protein CpaB